MSRDDLKRKVDALLPKLKLSADHVGPWKVYSRFAIRLAPPHKPSQE